MCAQKNTALERRSSGRYFYHSSPVNHILMVEELGNKRLGTEHLMIFTQHPLKIHQAIWWIFLIFFCRANLNFNIGELFFGNDCLIIC